MNRSAGNPLEEGQFELFSAAVKTSVRPEPNRVRIKNLTVSAENVIVSSIIFVMVTVVFFSFGVERGKRIAVKKGLTTQEALSPIEQPSGDGIVILQPPAVKKSEPTQAVSAQEKAVPAVQGTATGKEQVIDVRVPVELALKTEAEILYTIQVASVKLGSSYADKIASNLRGYGKETFILPKGNFSVVCVGKFKGKSEAQQFSKKLKSKYNDCLVRRL